MQPDTGVIFDIDGVVADTETVNAEVSIAVLRDLFGLEVRRADFAAGLGRGALAYVRAAAEVHGRALSEAEARRAADERQERFLAHLRTHPLPAFPGVLELMAEVRADPAARLAIATSSTRQKSRAVLAAVGIDLAGVVVLDGDDVERRKPHPELFAKAVERLGIAPRRCLVIEDAPNGAEAARRAGCRVLGVANSVPAGELDAADRVVPSLVEVGLAGVRALLA